MGPVGWGPRRGVRGGQVGCFGLVGVRSGRSGVSCLGFSEVRVVLQGFKMLGATRVQRVEGFVRGEEGVGKEGWLG